MKLNKEKQRYEYVTFLPHGQQKFTFVQTKDQETYRIRYIIIKPRSEPLSLDNPIKCHISKFRRVFNKVDSVFKGWHEDNEKGLRLTLEHDGSYMKLLRFIPAKKDVHYIHLLRFNNIY